MTERRPLVQVNKTVPGTDVAAETAAAMAAASLVFKSINSTYSDLLLQHAEKLFTFADKHRGIYSASIPQVQTYYNSTGYGDELLWAASWLYHATGDQTYLSYVTGENGDAYADWGRPTWFSWDDKRAGTQVHHRGASIPANAKTGCNGFQWLSSTDPNPNVAMGALVGGPFQNDSYIDSRNNSMQGEPSTYNSAVLVGLLSGLVTTSSVATSFT
ncbi:hypothetical protein BHE74_00020500 [Ensete ventricosum]|nr:hypothetical protein BHE74_00020500 [Ensete ventricosum]